MSVNGEPRVEAIIVNPLVEQIEQLLLGVKTGQITSVAVVLIPPTGGFGMFYGGPQKGDLFIGAHAAAKKLLDDMQAPQQQRPAILRPMMGI